MPKPPRFATARSGVRSSPLKALVRILWMLGSYYLASVSAAATGIALKVLKDRIGEVPGAGMHVLDFGPAFQIVSLIGLLVAMAMAVPAALVIGTGEAIGCRRWYFYCLGGGGAALASYIFAGPSSLPVPSTVPLLDSVGFVITVSGCIAGLVYWGMAGRHATGFLKRGHD